MIKDAREHYLVKHKDGSISLHEPGESLVTVDGVAFIQVKRAFQEWEKSSSR